MLTALHCTATAKQPIRLQEISGILATNFHTLNIPGTTSYGLVTNFWGKFPLAAPPPPRTARGKLANSLVPIQDLESVWSKARDRDKRKIGGGGGENWREFSPLTNAELP